MADSLEALDLLCDRLVLAVPLDTSEADCSRRYDDYLKIMHRKHNKTHRARKGDGTATGGARKVTRRHRRRFHPLIEQCSSRQQHAARTTEKTQRSKARKAAKAAAAAEAAH